MHILSTQVHYSHIIHTLFTHYSHTQHMHIYTHTHMHTCMHTHTHTHTASVAIGTKVNFTSTPSENSKTIAKDSFCSTINTFQAALQKLAACTISHLSGTVYRLEATLSNVEPGIVVNETLINDIKAKLVENSPLKTANRNTPLVGSAITVTLRSKPMHNAPWCSIALLGVRVSLRAASCASVRACVCLGGLHSTALRKQTTLPNPHHVRIS